MNAVVASLLPAPLRKRRDGVIPRLLRRLVLTPGLASLAAGATGDKRRRPPHHRLPTARKGRPARLPSGRAAWPTRLHAAGGRRACQEGGHPHSRLDGERRDARRAARAREGRLSWQSGLAPRCVQAGRPRRSSNWQARRPLPARERSEPRRQHRPLKAGMTPWHRFRSGAGRSVATTASYGSSRLARRVGLSSSWSWVRLPFLSSERGANRVGRVPCRAGTARAAR